MKILVERDVGSNIMAPETVVDPLCVTELVGISRGKAYLYDEGFDKKEYVITFVYSGAWVPTDLIAIHDTSFGESFVARVLSHSITVNTNEGGGTQVLSSLTVERSITNV